MLGSHAKDVCRADQVKQVTNSGIAGLTDDLGAMVVADAAAGDLKAMLGTGQTRGVVANTGLGPVGFSVDTVPAAWAFTGGLVADFGVFGDESQRATSTRARNGDLKVTEAPILRA